MSQGEGPQGQGPLFSDRRERVSERSERALRVLIVDDERLFAELMRVALSAAADIAVCGVVHDKATALASVSELRPGVVLSDYHLPDGTGADVARELRRAAPEISVLVLTGDPTVASAESGKAFLEAVVDALVELVRRLDAGAGGSYAQRPAEEAAR